MPAPVSTPTDTDAALPPSAVDIAFLTVNYKTLEYVRDLIAFFEGLDAPFSFSLTVVDNGSTDGSREFLAAQRGIRFIQSEENLGYGRAINRGVAATLSNYVCVMNTDVILNRDALAASWRFLEEHPGVTVCAPRISYPDGRPQGMLFEPSLLALYSEAYAKVRANRAKKRVGAAKEPVQVSGVMGAFFVIRRSAMETPPLLFDEEFFFFYEDTALSHALWKSGRQCFVLPEVSIVHVGGGSRSEGAIEEFYRSRYRYVRKFYGEAHERSVRFFDRLRIGRKLAVYSLLAVVGRSERIEAKKSRYKMAWEATGKA